MRLTKVFNGQPQYAARARSDISLTRGLSVLWNAAAPTLNAVSGQTAGGLGTGISPSTGLRGRVQSFTGSGTGQFRFNPGAEGAAISFYVLGSLSSGVSLSRVISNFNGSGGHDLYIDSGTLVYQNFRSVATGQWSRTSAADNALHAYVLTYDGSSTANDPVLYIDDALTAMTEVSAPSGTLVTPSLLCGVGGRPDVNFRQVGGSLALVMRFDRVLSSHEVEALFRNPWQVFQPQRIWVPVAGAGNDYTLTADFGAFTLTGNAAGLTAQRKLTASVGSFTLTGNSATLRHGRKLAAGEGAFAFSGYAAGLNAQRKLTAQTVSFALTGYDATLTYTPAAGAYTLTAETGDFAITGYAAGLNAQRRLSAAEGSFTFTGYDADLTYTPFSGAYTLTAGAGDFSLTGYAADLARSASLASGRIVRRRRTKFPKPEDPQEQVQEQPQAPILDAPRTSLVPDANSLVVAKVGEAQRLAKVAMTKRRKAIEAADEEAVERMLMEWF